MLLIGAVAVHAPKTCDVSALGSLSPAAPVTVTATITPNADGFTGVLAIDAFPPRTVRAPVCAEVAEALALIASMAMERIPAPASREPPPPDDRPTRPSPPLLYTRAVTALPRRWASQPRWHLSAGAAASATYGVTDEIGPAAPLFLELARGSIGLRATLLWARGHSDTVAISHVAARLEVCPLHTVVGDLELDPCAAAAVGALHGRALTGEDRTARAGLWLAPGLVLRARWRFAHPFFAEAELDGSVPLLRYRLVLAPQTTLFSTPYVAIRASLGLGVMFW